jgi:uncharacterized protein YchJ
MENSENTQHSHQHVHEDGSVCSHDHGSHGGHHHDHDHDHHHDEEVRVPYVRGYEKMGRNDPCSCGSGKKYKKCCLLTE